jgi:UDP-glucose 4-epimerase
VHLAGHPRFSVTIGSVLDETLIGPLVDQADTVFHLAAAVGVRLVMEKPIHTIHTNVHGTETVSGVPPGRPAAVVAAVDSSRAQASNEEAGAIRVTVRITGKPF